MVKNRPPKIWTFSPGEMANLWEASQKAGIIAMGWGEIGNLREYKSREEIKQALSQLQGVDLSLVNEANALWQFCYDLQIGDKVYVKRDTKILLGVGQVISDYIYDPSYGDFQHCRQVSWQKIGVWRLVSGIFTIKLLTDITQAKSFCKLLEDTVSDGRKEPGIQFQEASEVLPEGETDPIELEAMQPLQSHAKSYTKKDFLSQAFISEENYETLLRQLRRKKNLILQGPPGVGKSFLAPELAYGFMGEKNGERLLHVQLYPQYTYEDFLVSAKGADFKEPLAYGDFYNFCQKAEKSPKEPFFVILDPLNGCDLRALLGALLPQLEVNRRGQQVTLGHLGLRLAVPANLYLIGLLNTAVAQAPSWDYSLRRLFCYFELWPAYGKLKFQQYLTAKGAPEPILHKVMARMIDLNKIIEGDRHLGKAYRIGHSYFCQGNPQDPNWYEDIVRYELRPLLEEYWRDSPDTAKKIFEKLLR